MPAPLVGAAITVALFMLAGKATAKFCDGGGHFCSPPKECCTLGCCYNYPPPAFRPQTPVNGNLLAAVFWNHWYFWFVVAVSLLSCVGGCCLWRRRHCCCRSQSRDDISSERDSTGSCYPPPQYSRCSSFHHAPPPYTEVTSKPDLYPLVISYNDNGKGLGGNYLMVQYFRNCLVRPMTSLSATSTADSLSSSFLYATNEANTIIPPPYSCAGSLEEFQPSNPPPRSISSLTDYRQHNLHRHQHEEADDDEEASRLTGPGSPSIEQASAPGLQSLRLQQSYASAAALSTTGSDISSLAGVGTPDSPPQATSPTSEIRELLDKIQQLPLSAVVDVDETTSVEHQQPIPSRCRRYRNRNKMYMPLTLATPGRRKQRATTTSWLPRSAPTTPSTNQPPSLLMIARPSSSSSRKGDGSPLLEDRQSDDDQSDEML